MKFYDRTEELKELEAVREIAFENHSQMTAVMGRRRIGKTLLVNKSCENSTLIYLFVQRTTEKEICQTLSRTISEVLNEFVPDGIVSFVQLFELVMTFGKKHKFTFFIDEFQDFFKINPSIYSGIQNVWDKYKDTTNVNFVAAGSVQTMMHKVFMEYGEPLYGRCDSIINLKPFKPSVLKQIMKDANPGYTNDDLLALYAVTGGVPKYVEILVDRKRLTVSEIIYAVIRPNSIFLEEGKILLIQEFGKDYGKYFSILGAIAQGHNTISEISQLTGIDSCGGFLERLEKDYNLVSKARPVFAKPKSQNVRYEIQDNFLRFWFRYIVKYESYIQNGMIARVAEMAKEDYTTYSGKVLELYFREKLRETGKYYSIGSWWQTGKDSRGDQNEIDIVAVTPGDKTALIAEVKRNKHNFKPKEFLEKVEILKTKHLAKTEIETCCLSLEDM